MGLSLFSLKQCIMKLLRDSVSEISEIIKVSVKLRANACDIVGQQDAALLGPTCCERLHTMLCVVVCCCDLLEVVG